jgi:hypothetical protein
VAKGRVGHSNAGWWRTIVRKRLRVKEILGFEKTALVNNLKEKCKVNVFAGRPLEIYQELNSKSRRMISQRSGAAKFPRLSDFLDFPKFMPSASHSQNAD